MGARVRQGSLQRRFVCRRQPQRCFLLDPFGAEHGKRPIVGAAGWILGFLQWPAHCLDDHLAHQGRDFEDTYALACRLDGLGREQPDTGIATAVVRMAQALSLPVTAEGVERPGQLDWLRKRGCHEAQGFLLSKPLSARDFAQKFLRDARVAAAQSRSAGTPESKEEAAEAPLVFRRSL